MNQENKPKEKILKSFQHDMPDGSTPDPLIMSRYIARHTSLVMKKLLLLCLLLFSASQVMAQKKVWETQFALPASYFTTTAIVAEQLMVDTVGNAIVRVDLMRDVFGGAKPIGHVVLWVNGKGRVLTQDNYRGDLVSPSVFRFYFDRDKRAMIYNNSRTSEQYAGEAVAGPNVMVLVSGKNGITRQIDYAANHLESVALNESNQARMAAYVHATYDVEAKTVKLVLWRVW